ncbi:MAG: PIN domain-containing protein [Solirubrobacteraceae bacterium]
MLDAGALIALERGDRLTAVLIDEAKAQGRRLVVPAGVVGQVWRGGAAQAVIARALKSPSLSVDALSEAVARAAGMLCGVAGASDVIDASVVVAARQHKAIVMSSDREDLVRLDPTLSIIDC